MASFSPSAWLRALTNRTTATSTDPGYTPNVNVEYQDGDVVYLEGEAFRLRASAVNGQDYSRIQNGRGMHSPGSHSHNPSSTPNGWHVTSYNRFGDQTGRLILMEE